MKNNRRSMIMQLITEQSIQTQTQLQQCLEAQGVHTTQATLSRDIRDMKLVKQALPGGGFRYVLPELVGRDEHEEKLHKIFRESVVSCDMAQNLLVIRTLPGLAPAACSALDGMDISGLVGTIAGDDTAFLAMRDNDAAAVFYREIRQMF